MGFGNFFKKTMGTKKLDKSKINETSVYNILRNGVAPFEVTLPILEISGGGNSATIIKNGIAITSTAPIYKKNRKIRTNVQCNSQQLIVRHALEDGTHFFINFLDIAYVRKINNGVSIEIHDGKKCIFKLNRHMKNQWKSLGFNPQFILDVFYNLFIDERWRIIFGNSTPYAMKYQTEQSTPHEINEKTQRETELVKKFNEKAEKHPLKEKLNDNNDKLYNEYKFKIPCPVCGKTIKEKAIRCKFCKTNLKEFKNTPEYLKKKRNLLKQSKFNSQSSLKQCPNCGKEILSNAIRCKYCKTMLKKY